MRGGSQTAVVWFRNARENRKLVFAVMAAVAVSCAVAAAVLLLLAVVAAPVPPRQQQHVDAQQRRADPDVDVVNETTVGGREPAQPDGGAATDGGLSVDAVKSANLTAPLSSDGGCPLHFALDPSGTCRPVFSDGSGDGGNGNPSGDRQERQGNQTNAAAATDATTSASAVAVKRYPDHGNLIHRPLAEQGTSDCKRGFVKDVSGKCRPVLTNVRK